MSIDRIQNLQEGFIYLKIRKYLYAETQKKTSIFQKIVNNAKCTVTDINFAGKLFESPFQ